MEWQSKLYVNFVDFERAFDSVDSEVIWRLTQHHRLTNPELHVTSSPYLEVLRIKIRIFNTNAKAVLFYGSETWRETMTNVNKLQTFNNRCL
jgi:hypothetical protein